MKEEENRRAISGVPEENLSTPSTQSTLSIASTQSVSSAPSTLSIASTPSTDPLPGTQEKGCTSASGPQIEQHDSDLIRCRRLGHEVPFGYCRKENLGAPCRLVLDCWWERFDARGFLEANLPSEVYARIASGSQPPHKIATLFDLIEKARGLSRAGE